MQTGDGELISGKQRRRCKFLGLQSQDEVGDDLGGVDQEGVFKEQLVAVGELRARRRAAA